jgi:hypothetical protein
VKHWRIYTGGCEDGVDAGRRGELRQLVGSEASRCVGVMDGSVFVCVCCMWSRWMNVCVCECKDEYTCVCVFGYDGRVYVYV